jgi:O-antigen biosynthesis protein
MLSALDDPLSDHHHLAPARIGERPFVRGKFIFTGELKRYIRGVTYGTFSPSEAGDLFPDPQQVSRDFSHMSALGINTVRTYTVPPRWLLDLAASHGLMVMIGIPWEQHITFLDNKEHARSIEERIRAGVRSCAKHPAILCYTIGNEIPTQIVRWHGRKKIERFLKRLYNAAKSEDPEGLVTYVNYPSTEYLQLPFLDFVCFNVYLESPDRLDAYISRLQNIAGDSPLVLAEMGLDSRKHGLDEQAKSLKRQIHSVFSGGCAGTGISGSHRATEPPSPRYMLWARHLQLCPFPSMWIFPVSQWWYAVTMVRGSSASAWTPWPGLNTPITK